MEILFNELSLHGQFTNIENFVKVELIGLITLLKKLEHFSVQLLKKSTAWNCLITEHYTLHNLLTSKEFRSNDEITRFKSAIANLTREPFWDNNSLQDPRGIYVLGTKNISGSSVAEACERDKSIISFINSEFSFNPMVVLKNEIEITLVNLVDSSQLIQLLWQKKLITFETYIKAEFGNGKLRFTNVDNKMGFSIVRPEEQELFIETFRKFERMPWEQIHVDKGLNYKQFHNSLGNKYRGLKTYKFRASEKFRCHGYRENGLFIVIGFETGHLLSDIG
jgi:hypothetical protein